MIERSGMAFEKDKARLEYVSSENWDLFKRNVPRHTTIKTVDGCRVVVATCWDLDLYTNTLLCLDRYFADKPGTAEDLYQAMQALDPVWPIYGFRCSGAPYITNQDEIDRELTRREREKDIS